MIAQRLVAVSAWLVLGAAATAAPKSSTAALPPFTVQDLVRLERISELASSPDGKRLAYTLRTTDMDANKGRTSIWLAQTGKRADAQRLTDLAANSSAAEWSGDGRFVYFLSNRSGSTQVWRVAAGAPARRSAPHPATMRRGRTRSRSPTCRSMSAPSGSRPRATASW